MKKLVLLLTIMVSTIITFAQGELKVFPEWIAANGLQVYFFKNVIKTDPSDNVYVAGATLNSFNNYDILINKYDPDGALLWTQNYNGSGNGNDAAIGLFMMCREMFI
jgi:hypothetical protein